MGLRTASVRHPHVEVMAPALTDTNQSQNYKLAHNQSPINGSSKTTTAATAQQQAAEHLYNNKHHELNNVFDNLNTLVLATELLKSGGGGCSGFMMNQCPITTSMDEEQQQHQHQQQQQQHQHLHQQLQQQQQQQPDVNQDDTTTNKIMGGLQKTTTPPLQHDDHLIAANLSLLNKTTTNNTSTGESDVEQLLQLNVDGDNVVDDLMQQVIKSFDGSDVTMALEKELLFNECDVMNMSIEEQLVDATTVKEAQTKEMLIDVQRKHAKLERRMDFLLRRIRKFQIRNMGQHVSGEVAGIFEHVHRTLRRCKDNNLQQQQAQQQQQQQHQAISNPQPQQQDVTVDSTTNNVMQDVQPPITPVQTIEKLKPISYSSTKNLVKKLETSVVLQANNASRQRHSTRYFGSGSSEPSSFRANVSGLTMIPQWAPDEKLELQRVSGYLESEIKMVQDEVDSEATVSSSGGESCDEMQTYNNPHQQFLPIHKRAAWKYAMDRAAIACRWTWLQSQVSDLEYRIRQHSDLHRKIRASKQQVKLGGLAPPPPNATTAAANTTATLNSSSSVPPSSPTCVNGYRGPLPGASSIKPLSTTNVDCSSSSNSNSASNNAIITTSTNTTQIITTVTTTTPANGSLSPNSSSTCPDYQCARTRPLINFRKRKLLQLNGLHAVSKKAARSASIKCGCVSPKFICALCTGRTDPTYPRDIADYLSKNEKLGLLDPSYHPVFSLNEDASASLHMEAIMKTPEWQQRSSRSNLKSLKYIKGDRIGSEKQPTNASAAAATAAGENRPRKLEHRRKYNRLIKSSTANALSAKIKNRFRGRKPLRNLKKRSRILSQFQAVGSDGADEEVEQLGINASGGNKYESPSTSPLLTAQTISGFQKRNRVDSYDIDNIIIPYSVAASTRVEKLPYKEILTPKWRIAESECVVKYDVKNNGIVKTSQENNDEDEDLSEDAVVIRHEKCELEEKKKFLSYLKLPIGYGRSRGNRRTDSRAESSGANTPDPMSPAPSLQQNNNNNTTTALGGGSGGGDSDNNPSKENSIVSSPITSPPATPLPPQQLDDNTSSNSAVPTPPLVSTNTATTTGAGTTTSMNLLRRRTISQSRIVKTQTGDKELVLISGGETRSNTPIEQQQIEVQPYDKRTFPLNEDSYDKMVRSMPDEHKLKTNIRSQDSSAVPSPASEEYDDKLDFHDSESTESAFGDEDPNDPEWDMERVKERHRR